MQILVSGEQSVLMSIHFDKGTVPEIIETADMADRVCVKEVKIGKVVIQLFERD